MDRLEKLEAKVAALARWFSPVTYDVIDVHRDIAAIDAEPEPPTRVKGVSAHEAATDRLCRQTWEPIIVALQDKLDTLTVHTILSRVDALIRERDAYKRAKTENDERFMIERDTARQERDAALAKLGKTAAAHSDCIHDRDAARAEVERLTAEVATLRVRDAEARWVLDKKRSYSAEWEDRRDAYLAGKVAPDPLLVEVRAALLGLVESRLYAGPCWCRRDDPHVESHHGYCARVRAILAQIDARIGGGG